MNCICSTHYLDYRTKNDLDETKDDRDAETLSAQTCEAQENVVPVSLSQLNVILPVDGR